MSKFIKRRPTIKQPLTSPYHASTTSERPSASGSSHQDLSLNEDHLPLVRAPSPLRLDIPTHHPWHDRRTNFDLSPKQGSHHSGTTVLSSPLTVQKTSSSTEALAALIWIGTSSMGASVPTTCVPPYHPKSNTVPASREIDVLFSMAVDENLPDEIVVERLEIIRKHSARMDKDTTRSTSHGLTDVPPSSKRAFNLTEFQLGEYPVHNTSSACRPGMPGPGKQSLPASVDNPELDSDDATVWRTARKALFCIREILRTERKYREALKALLAGQTANPPPLLMLSHLPGLIRVSEALLKADPSAWGVSIAFIACEDDIETAMVSWSSVVGSFFSGNSSKETESPSIGEKWRRRKSLVLSATGYPLPPLVRKSSRNSAPASPSDFPPLLSLMNDTWSRTGERQQTDERYRMVSSDGSVDSPAARRSRRISLVDEKDDRADDSKGDFLTRKPTVRDLAIQPTQRVMRYVLLYQDLLENTPPTSPSHALVERALEAATHIASKCNRAQCNTNLLRR